MIRAAVRYAFIVIVATAAEAGAAEVPSRMAIASKIIGRRRPLHCVAPRLSATDEAEAIWRSHSASFVDVLPRAAATARTCPREPFGTTNRGPIFPAASGCLTPDMANSRPAWPAISPRGLEKATHGDHARIRCFILSGGLLDVVERSQARAVARLFECRLVSRGDRWLERRRPSAGRCHARATSGRIARPSRQASRSGHLYFAGVSALQDCPGSPSQIKQPLLDEHRHIAHV